MKVVGQNVKKAYHDGGGSYEVFKNLDFDLDPGAGPIAIIGASGSGKSTLLSLIGGLDVPDEGAIIIDGMNLSRLNNEQRARHRLKNLGYIFQEFNLLPDLRVWENVALPAVARGSTFRTAHSAAVELLDQIGCRELAHRYIDEISGGQMQRVAIARALINKPKLILADEPTGNLDRGTAFRIFDLLCELSELGSALIVVTHDEELAAKMPFQYVVQDGKLTRSVR